MGAASAPPAFRAERAVRHHEGAAAACRPTAPAALRRREPSAVLRLDVIDLLLIHWPNPAVPIRGDDARVVAAQAPGPDDGTSASRISRSPTWTRRCDLAEPIVTEPDRIPSLSRSERKLLAAIRRHGLAITAYCPIALGKVVGDDSRARARHGKTAVQVALRWLVQQPDVIAIPRTSQRERLRRISRSSTSIDRRRNGSHKSAHRSEFPPHQRAPVGSTLGLFLLSRVPATLPNDQEYPLPRRPRKNSFARLQARPMPTMDDVARASGVSQMTVSRGLSSRPRRSGRRHAFAF